MSVEPSEAINQVPNLQNPLGEEVGSSYEIKIPYCLNPTYLLSGTVLLGLAFWNGTLLLPYLQTLVLSFLATIPLYTLKTSILTSLNQDFRFVSKNETGKVLLYLIFRSLSLVLVGDKLTVVLDNKVKGYWKPSELPTKAKVKQGGEDNEENEANFDSVVSSNEGKWNSLLQLEQFFKRYNFGYLLLMVRVYFHLSLVQSLYIYKFSILFLSLTLGLSYRFNLLSNLSFVKRSLGSGFQVVLVLLSSLIETNLESNVTSLLIYVPLVLFNWHLFWTSYNLVLEWFLALKQLVGYGLTHPYVHRHLSTHYDLDVNAIMLSLSQLVKDSEFGSKLPILSQVVEKSKLDHLALNQIFSLIDELKFTVASSDSFQIYLTNRKLTDQLDLIHEFIQTGTELVKPLTISLALFLLDRIFQWMLALTSIQLLLTHPTKPTTTLKQTLRTLTSTQLDQLIQVIESTTNRYFLTTCQLGVFHYLLAKTSFYSLNSLAPNWFTFLNLFLATIPLANPAFVALVPATFAFLQGAYFKGAALLLIHLGLSGYADPTFLSNFGYVHPFYLALVGFMGFVQFGIFGVVVAPIFLTTMCRWKEWYPQAHLSTPKPKEKSTSTISSSNQVEKLVKAE